MSEPDAHSSTQPAKGDAFQEFERTLPENCVEYLLLIIEPDLENKKPDALSSLEAVRKAAVQLSNHLAKDYIWQREAFTLETKSTNGTVLTCLTLTYA